MRLGLFPYLALIGALLGAQYMAATTLEGSDAITAALLGLQLLKLPVAAARARDLGYDGDEAVLALLPLANLALFWKLLGGTPSDAVRAKRQAVHAGESSAWGLVAWGLKAFGPSAPFALTAWIVVSVLDVWVVQVLMGQVDTIRAQDPGRLVLIAQVLWGVFVLQLIYTVLQLGKAATVSRASWLPAVFLPTTFFFGVSAWMLGNLGAGADPSQAMMIGSVTMGLGTLPVYAVGGAWAAAVSHQCATAILRGERPSGASFAAAFSRLAEMSGPHAAVRYLIFVGLQFAVPGLMYASQYALVDQVAWDEPEARALRRAGDLTRNHRQRVLRALIIVAMPVVIAYLVIVSIGMGSVDQVQGLIVNPYGPPPMVGVAMAVASAFGFALAELSLTKMYAERVAVTSAAASQPVAEPERANVFEPPAT